MGAKGFYPRASFSGTVGEDLRRALAQEGGRHVLEVKRGGQERRALPVTITMVSIEDL